MHRTWCCHRKLARYGICSSAPAFRRWVSHMQISLHECWLALAKRAARTSGAAHYTAHLPGLTGSHTSLHDIQLPFAGQSTCLRKHLTAAEAYSTVLGFKPVQYVMQGTGYSACGTCGGMGAVPPQSSASLAEQSGSAQTKQSRARSWKAAMSNRESCGNCSGTGKVMCTACLCTGKKVAREHDPRLDPFS